MCPYKFEDEIFNLDGKPLSMDKNAEEGFIIEVRNKRQNEKIDEINSILGNECTVKDHVFLNVTKGIIYVYNNKVSDIEGVRQGLQERYSQSSVNEAKWIKPKNEKAKGLHVVFQWHEGISIPETAHAL